MEYPRRTAQPFALRPGPAQACLHLLADDLPFEFRHAGDDHEHDPARWAGKIQLFSERHKVNTEMLEFL